MRIQSRSISVMLVVSLVLVLLAGCGRAYSAVAPVVAVATEDAISYAFDIARELRDAGIAASTTMRLDRIGDQFKVASKLNVPVVLAVVGEEVARGTVNKNLRDVKSEEKDSPRQSMLERVRHVLQ